MSEKYYLDTDGLITKNCGWGAIAKFGEYAVIDELNALQKRLDYFQGIMNEYSADLAGLRTSISEAVKEIELEWLNGVAGTDGNRDDVYQSGAGKALDILRKHGLIGGE